MGAGVSSYVEGCGVAFPVPHNENIKNESIVNKFFLSTQEDVN
jgi:hypothetical protein